MVMLEQPVIVSFADQQLGHYWVKLCAIGEHAAKKRRGGATCVFCKRPKVAKMPRPNLEPSFCVARYAFDLHVRT
jgi:hypothetical protein